MFLKRFLFVAIILVAIFFRFWQLSIIPPSPSLDEASIGWNAYSIMQTGKDEYGYSFPILLRAYDDYRPALYVYSVIPSIKIFGLSAFAVRFPSALMSIVDIVLAFFLVKSIFSTYKKKETLAFLTMLFLAVSPWHIYISRLGHEADLGLFLILLTAFLFFKGIEKKKGMFISLSLIFASLSLYSYQSEKVFMPLLVVLLFGTFFKQLLHFKKYLVIGIILGLLVALPITLESLKPLALVRVKATSIFNENTNYSTDATKLLISQRSHNFFGQVFYNRRFTTARIFAQNYATEFNPWWLFTNGVNDSFKAPLTGLMYIFYFPLLIIGLIFLFVKKEINTKVKLIIIGWILISAVAPGLTVQAPQAMRTFNVLPIPEILVGLGIAETFFLLFRQTKTIAFTALFLLSIIAAKQIADFSYNYFVKFPIVNSQSFRYAFGPAIQYVQKNHGSFQKVVFAIDEDRFHSFFESYMFYLFYTKYSPKKYLQQGGTVSGSFSATHKIDNIEFKSINWSQSYSKENTLFVGNPEDFPNTISPVFKSYYLDGLEGVRIVAR